MPKTTGARSGPARRGSAPARRAPVTTRTGLQLDPASPEDAKILDRQQAVAREAGRTGQDKERATGGRADLQQAYDEGAAAAAAPAGPAAAPSKTKTSSPAAAPAAPARPATAPKKTAPAPAPGRGPRAGAGARRGFTRSSAALSRGSWRPRLQPPARARDAGGLAFGLLLYTAAITYIRYGPAGWTGWLSAKFLNKPMQGLPTSKGGPPATPAQVPAKPPTRLEA
jgi:hypothetical protein